MVSSIENASESIWSSRAVPLHRFLTMDLTIGAPRPREAQNGENSISNVFSCRLVCVITPISVPMEILPVTAALKAQHARTMRNLSLRGPGPIFGSCLGAAKAAGFYNFRPRLCPGSVPRGAARRAVQFGTRITQIHVRNGNQRWAPMCPIL